MYPGNLLPPGIWSKIFDEVGDAQDWLNLRRASPSFEELVGGDKVTEKLFPVVFPTVFEQYRKTAATRSDILQLRLVCRQWDQVLDSLLLQQGKDLIEVPYEFLDLQSLSSFLQKFEAHSRNPFIGKHASFQFPHHSDAQLVEEYESLMTRFLAKFGTQIRSLQITDFPENGTRDFGNVARRLRNVLQATPNLEGLSLSSVCDFVEDLQRDDDRDGDGAQVIPYIEGGPLPTTSNLKSLRFSFGISEWRCAGELQNVVLRMCGNGRESLKDLEIVGIPSETETLVNLETATLHLTTREEIMSRRLSSCSWPLTHLTLTTWAASDDTSFSIRAAFEVAQHFRDTLIALKLEGGYGNMSDFGSPLKAVLLPHLKSLTLPEIIRLQDHHHHQVVENLDGLQLLCFHYCRYPEETLWEDLIARLETNIRDSRIWSKSPKLSTIELSYGSVEYGNIVRKSFYRELIK